MCHHASKCEMDALLSINYDITLLFYSSDEIASKIECVCVYIVVLLDSFIHSSFVSVRVLLFEHVVAHLSAGFCSSGVVWLLSYLIRI